MRLRLSPGVPRNLPEDLLSPEAFEAPPRGSSWHLDWDATVGAQGQPRRAQPVLLASVRALVLDTTEWTETIEKF